MEYIKKSKLNKSQNEGFKKNSTFVPYYGKVKNMLAKGKIPTVTLFFNPHVLKSTARNSKGIIKRIKTPTKTIVLNQEFLKDYKGKSKNTYKLIQDILDIVHDEGAISFKI